eukprot:s1995_g10.t1
MKNPDSDAAKASGQVQDHKFEKQEERHACFGGGLLLALQGGLLVPLRRRCSAGCRCRALLGLPLQSAASGWRCQIWSWLAGTTPECRGAAAGCCLLLSECGLCCETRAWLLATRQGDQSGVRAVELGCLGHSKVPPLRNLGAGSAAGGRCEMSMLVSALGPDGDYFYTVSKKDGVWLLLTNIFCYLGSMLPYIQKVPRSSVFQRNLARNVGGELSCGALFFGAMHAAFQEIRRFWRVRTLFRVAGAGHAGHRPHFIHVAS